MKKMNVSARRLATLIAPVLVIVLGVLVLIGWVFDINLLIHILPQFSGMNPLTATLFIALSLSIIFLHPHTEDERIKLMGWFLTLFVFSVSYLRLLDILLDEKIGVDLIFFREKILFPGQSPSRMALATSICFLVLGGSIIFLKFKRRKLFLFVGQMLLLVSLVIVVPALFFYLGEGAVFLRIPLYFSMAFHTALAFLALTFTLVICVRDICNEKFYMFNPKIITTLLFFSVPIWVFMVAPSVIRLPINFTYNAEIYSIDNFYNEEMRGYSGEINSNTIFSYSVEDVKDGVLEIKNIFDVRSPTGEKILSVERLYGIDPYTRKHVAGYGDKDRGGFLFAPKNLNKQDFTYWHISYDSPVNMKFAEEEEILGLKVYRYEANFTADQTEDLSYLPDVGKTMGIDLDVNLKLWVEPFTGHLIKSADDSVAYYYDLRTGERTHPWNHFKNSYSERAVEKQVNLAQQEIVQKELVETVIPVILFVISLLCFISIILGRYNKNLPSALLPVITLLVSLSITLVLWQSAGKSVEQRARAKFENEATTLRGLVLDRMEIYANALQGGRGLFVSSEDVNRGEWKSYVEGVNIQKNYPGVQGLGYAIVLEPNEVVDFENNVHKEGFPDFKVFPDGDREIYTPIIYLEPFDFRNQRTFGYDMFSEPTRRAAMEYARDNDAVSITGKVLLLQETEEDIQPGFLMYVPFYSKDNSIQGYIYSPFRMHDFMRTTLFNQSFNIDLQIFDGDRINEETEMYDYDRGKYSGDPDYNPRFQKSDLVDLYGHSWTFRYVSLPSFSLGEFQEGYPNLILRIGLVFSVLITLTIYTLNSSRARATKLADDITKDLKKRTEELESANSKLLELDKIKDEFLSVASHELRTPLTAIDGLVAMIRDGDYGKVNKKLKQPLEDINTSSERLIHLVNDLLSVTRIQAGRLKFTLAEFNIKNTIIEIVKLLDVVAKEKGLSIKTKDMQNIKVFADEAKVGQVLNNLVGNSLKFTDEGGIVVSTKVEKDHLTVFVKDTGIGMRKEDQIKIFERFEQLETGKGRPAGTGLGLYISKELCQKMGGNLALVDSEPGRGSMFAFSIPLAGSAIAKKVEREISANIQKNPEQKSDLIEKARKH